LTKIIEVENAFNQIYGIEEAVKQPSEKLEEYTRYQKDVELNRGTKKVNIDDLFTTLELMFRDKQYLLMQLLEPIPEDLAKKEIAKNGKKIEKIICDCTKCKDGLNHENIESRSYEESLDYLGNEIHLDSIDHIVAIKNEENEKVPCSFYDWFIKVAEIAGVLGELWSTPQKSSQLFGFCSQKDAETFLNLDNKPNQMLIRFANKSFGQLRITISIKEKSDEVHHIEAIYSENQPKEQKFNTRYFANKEQFMEIVNIVARRFKINYIYDGIKIEPRKIEKKQGYSKNTSAFVDTVEKMKMMQLNSSLPSNSQTHVFLGISSQNLAGFGHGSNQQNPQTHYMSNTPPTNSNNLPPQHLSPAPANSMPDRRNNGPYRRYTSNFPSVNPMVGQPGTMHSTRGSQVHVGVHASQSPQARNYSNVGERQQNPQLQPGNPPNFGQFMPQIRNQQPRIENPEGFVGMLSQGYSQQHSENPQDSIEINEYPHSQDYVPISYSAGQFPSASSNNVPRTSYSEQVSYDFIFSPNGSPKQNTSPQSIGTNQTSYDTYFNNN
uniref:SH2 domain-containing protein n=1 Tax=Acrobeloides nanus TaxID=290746 RepID=A0A914DHV0_9BILA